MTDYYMFTEERIKTWPNKQARQKLLCMYNRIKELRVAQDVDLMMCTGIERYKHYAKLLQSIMACDIKYGYEWEYIPNAEPPSNPCLP